MRSRNKKQIQDRWGPLAKWLARSLTDHLTWWLIAAAVAGLTLPGLDNTFRDFTPLILAVMIGGLGLTLRLADLTASLRNWKLLGAALATQVISTPLLALVIWPATDQGTLAQGLVVQATAPSEVTSPLMVYLAGGSLAGAVSILGISILLAPLTMPLLLQVILGRTVPVPAGEMLISLALTVALPLLAGSTIHTLAPTIRARLARLGSALSAAMVILLVLAVAAGTRPALLANPTAIIGPTLIGSSALLAVGLIAGWAAGHLGGFNTPEQHSLLFTTGMREFGIATAVALAFFDPLTAILPAVYGIIMMITTSRLAHHIARRHHSRRAEKST